MAKCLISGSDYDHFIDFGEMPIANAFGSKEDMIDEYTFPMKVGFCEESKMVQLVNQPSRERMFHESYAFFSSTSDYMKKHFKKFASSVSELQSLSKDSLVVEIGSNDGIMLQNFLESNIPCLGIEPSKNVAKVASDKGIDVITEFFDMQLAESIVQTHGKADAILSANVMCHIPYMHSIYDGVKFLLKEDGVFIFEDPYLGEVIEKSSFDQIYDEHVYIFSAISVKNIFEISGFELIDVIPQETHGGSMRYVLCKKGMRKISENVINLIKKEKDLNYRYDWKRKFHIV